MKKNKKTVSMSIDYREKQNFLAKPDIFLQSFMEVRKKYGEIAAKQKFKCYQKQPKDDTSTNRISQLIYNQINIKKKQNFVLPPIKHKIEYKISDSKRDKQLEIIDIINTIKDKDEASFQKSKVYEEELMTKKLFNSHQFLNLIMMKKGVIH